MGVFKADYACGWACGGRVPKGRHRKRLCSACTAFLREYGRTKGYTDRSLGDERYEAAKAERVERYRVRAAAGLPLFGGQTHAVVA